MSQTAITKQGTANLTSNWAQKVLADFLSKKGMPQINVNELIPLTSRGKPRRAELHWTSISKCGWLYEIPQSQCEFWIGAPGGVITRKGIFQIKVSYRCDKRILAFSMTRHEINSAQMGEKERNLYSHNTEATRPDQVKQGDIIWSLKWYSQDRKILSMRTIIERTGEQVGENNYDKE